MFLRLRWIAVAVAALVVGTLEIVSDGLLDADLPFPVDTLLVVGVVCVLTFAFATVTLSRIDALTGDLERRNAELEARAASASALHRVTVASAALHDLDEVLVLVVDSARRLLIADVALVTLNRPDGSAVVRARSGPEGTVVDQAPTAAGSEDAVAFVRPEYAAAHLAVPLQRGPDTIGQLIVGSRSPRTWAVDAVETLGSLANQASVAIENANLQARLRELAVVDERERIAREMHDGLAQVLGYVNTKSQAADVLLADGRTAEARAQLAELAAAARSVYVDVREAILGLRSPIRDGQDLVPAIESYAARYADAAKVAVTVDADPGARAAILTPAAQANVFRILQECLTNVRKHAGASRAIVSLRAEEGRFVLRVADDGRGMASGTTIGGTTDSWPHYGIAAMQERAEAVGGTIDWTERAEGGTEVAVSVPAASTATAAVPAGRS